MDSLSVVVITKNEGLNIKRCLDSITSLAKEIIVVDSFSTDNTRDICESYANVIFKSREFIDYSDAKNFGNKLATGDWIFSIDADEAVSPNLFQRIKTTLEMADHDAFIINRLTNYCGKFIRHSGWYPDAKIRLWRNGVAHWEGAIHEDLIVNSDKVTRLKGDLFHYSYPSMEVHLNKINHFTTLMAQDMYAKGKKASMLKILFGPIGEFLKKYILKKGVLDGYYGFVIATLSAYYKFCKYAKLKSLWIQHGGAALNE
jgi:glycosyltransferase involved in cell wall biosynthesis